MAWIIFGIAVWVTVLLVVPFKLWRRFWKMGLIGILVILSIDSSLVNLGAFKFNSGIAYFGQIPAAYLLAAFPGAILYAYFYPEMRNWRFPYVLICAFMLLLMELLMVSLGYFQYVNWNPAKSLVLNIFGFAVMSGAVEWLGLKSKSEVRV